MFLVEPVLFYNKINAVYTNKNIIIISYRERMNIMWYFCSCILWWKIQKVWTIFQERNRTFGWVESRTNFAFLWLKMYSAKHVYRVYMSNLSRIYLRAIVKQRFIWILNKDIIRDWIWNGIIVNRIFVQKLDVNK